MARQNASSTISSEAHAQLLHDSLERYNESQHKTKRPSFILAALISLFISSVGGIALAIVLMVRVVAVEAICFSRDFMLFAGIMSLLYISLHIYGARRDYKREGLGPPQLYGQYLHGSAVLVARLGIVTWIGTLGATVVMIARGVPLEGFSARVPFLNLLLCVGAIPSFLVISVTIERNSKPFATTSISRPSFLTCRVSQFADDISADMSVSRRSSLQRKQSHTASVLTLKTEEMFSLGGQQPNEKFTCAPKKQEFSAREKRASLPAELPKASPSAPAEPTPQTSDSTATQAVPQPTYCPGGWRTEWNNVAQEVGVPQITAKSTDGSSSSETSSPPPQVPPKTAAAASSTAVPSSSQKSQLPTAPTNNANTNTTTTTAAATNTTTPTPTATTNTPTQQRYSYRHSITSARLSGSIAPSNLSTVRYASEPEIAVQQSIRVVRNPAYRPRAGSAGTNECKGIEKPDVALLRDAQGKISVPKRTLSNYSRPLQKTGTEEESKGDSEAGSGGDVKIPGALLGMGIRDDSC
ncbi:hypothetical protein F4678DRAFT_412287 [Xylaria arbuscula]|nr:hypothetical protein F4678DRAFT_412287 [Xylaria arbuscula]